MRLDARTALYQPYAVSPVRTLAAANLQVKLVLITRELRIPTRKPENRVRLGIGRARCHVPYPSAATSASALESTSRAEKYYSDLTAAHMFANFPLGQTS